MTVTKTGDWQAARRVLGASGSRLKQAITTAVKQEAQVLRGRIVEGLTRQAPGGNTLTPLAPTTLAARALKGFGGTKALLRRGDLRNSITAVVEGDTAFVGVKRQAQGGKGMANLAELHEFGAGPFTVVMTARMRRFLFAVLRRAGKAPGSGGGGGGGLGVVVIRIPPRPFLRPAFEAYRKEAPARFLRRVAAVLGLSAAPP
jgi:phage gpG-like protein